MTALLRRQAVIDKYAEIIGRNLYSQSLRDYCYKPYKDGNYYSDCSSSICYAYKEAGQGFGTVSYTHLDVYKRQVDNQRGFCAFSEHVS